jgi:hypothetical protein
MPIDQKTIENMCTIVESPDDLNKQTQSGNKLVLYFSLKSNPTRLFFNSVDSSLVKDVLNHYGVQLLFVDTQEHPDVVRAQGIPNIPYMQAFKEGKPVAQCKSRYVPILKFLEYVRQCFGDQTNS